MWNSCSTRNWDKYNYILTEYLKSTFGKGIRVIAKDSSFSMKFSTRFQSLMAVELPLQANGKLGEAKSNFMIRRFRLKFDGFVYNPKVVYKIELGLSNNDIGSPIEQTDNSARIILDAVIKWEFAKNTQLWIGQTKLPGNRERVISSQKLQFVDRSLLNSKYNIDRDIGIQLYHKWKAGNMVIREAFAFSQGEGRNITSGNAGGYKYTGRIEILPMGEFTGNGDYFGSDLKREENPKLSVGVTYDFHDDAVRQHGNMMSYMSEAKDIGTFFTDMMFKFKGISVMAEHANKQPQGIAIIASDSSYFYTGSGINVQAGYLFKNNIEVAVRYTKIQPSTENLGDIIGLVPIEMYTLGFSKYIVGHSLKFQSDLSWTDQGEDDNLLVRMQVEMAF